MATGNLLRKTCLGDQIGSEVTRVEGSSDENICLRTGMLANRSGCICCGDTHGYNLFLEDAVGTLLVTGDLPKRELGGNDDDETYNECVALVFQPLFDAELCAYMHV